MTSEHQSTYARTNVLHGDVLAFVLGPEVEALQKRARVTADGRAGKTLVKEGSLRITLVGLRAGSQLEEHHVAGPVLVQGLSGVTRVTTSSGEIELGPGALIALDEGVAHAAQAVEDCALLIVVALQLEASSRGPGADVESGRSSGGAAPESAPELFPCMRSLAVGEFAVLAGGTVYCPTCYETVSTLWPGLAEVAERFQLKRGLTCGGGHAED